MGLKSSFSFGSASNQHREKQSTQSKAKVKIYGKLLFPGPGELPRGREDPGARGRLDDSEKLFKHFRETYENLFLMAPGPESPLASYFWHLNT